MNTSAVNKKVPLLYYWMGLDTADWYEWMLCTFDFHEPMTVAVSAERWLVNLIYSIFSSQSNGGIAWRHRYKIERVNGINYKITNLMPGLKNAALVLWEALKML